MGNLAGCFIFMEHELQSYIERIQTATAAKIGARVAVQRIIWSLPSKHSKWLCKRTPPRLCDAAWGRWRPADAGVPTTSATYAFGRLTASGRCDRRGD